MNASCQRARHFESSHPTRCAPRYFKPRKDTMRHKIISFLSSATILLGCIAAQAQQMQNGQAQIPQHLQDLAGKSQNSKPETSQPSAELQSLVKALSGKWAVNVKFEPNPEMPNGFAGTGEETWRAGPGGYTLLDEERLPTPKGDVYLLGIIWWDGTTKSLHGMECNNQLPYICDLKGGLNDVTMHWDGRQFVIDEWETHGGKKTLWHEVWLDITATSFTQTGDVEEPDGATKRFFTMQAKRVGDAGK